MQQALFNPETSISIQKRHPYIGNLNSETLGDSKNAFLHWGDVLGTFNMPPSSFIAKPLVSKSSFNP